MKMSFGQTQLTGYLIIASALVGVIVTASLAVFQTSKKTQSEPANWMTKVDSLLTRAKQDVLPDGPLYNGPNYWARTEVALVLVSVGRCDEALQWVVSRPLGYGHEDYGYEDERGLLSMMRYAVRLGQADQMLKGLHASSDPQSIRYGCRAHCLLGVALSEAGKTDQAEELVDEGRGLAKDVQDQAIAALGLARTGRRAEARRLFRDELARVAMAAKDRSFIESICLREGEFSCIGWAIAESDLPAGSFRMPAEFRVSRHALATVDWRLADTERAAIRGDHRRSEAAVLQAIKSVPNLPILSLEVLVRALKYMGGPSKSILEAARSADPPLKRAQLLSAMAVACHEAANADASTSTLAEARDAANEVQTTADASLSYQSAAIASVAWAIVRMHASEGKGIKNRPASAQPE